MRRSVCTSMLVLLAVASFAACGRDAPTALPRATIPPSNPFPKPNPTPNPIPTPNPNPNPPGPSPFADSTASTIYERSSPSSFASGSRFVFYSDGKFDLTYVYAGDYSGRYTRTDSTVALVFDGWSVAGPWLAGGTFRGDTLTVDFNVIMMLSDFESGTYLRR